MKTSYLTHLSNALSPETFFFKDVKSPWGLGDAPPGYSTCLADPGPRFNLEHHTHTHTHTQNQSQITKETLTNLNLMAFV
jgi:hypothetical protein